MATTNLSAFALEQAIERVKGVVSSRVTTGNGEGVSEIHVLARPERNPKQIVRDVESVCATLFGFTLDHRKVSVAQLDKDGPRHSGDSHRLRFRALQMETDGLNVRVRVQIEVGEGVFEGVAVGPGTEANRLRLAAQGALRAMEEYLQGTCRFFLEGTAAFATGRWHGMLAAVTMISPQGHDDLLGSALVEADKGEAAVKAVMSAVNRRVRFEGE